MKYTVEPPISEKEFYIRGKTSGEIKNANGIRAICSESAGSIGGADGPTAVTLLPKTREEGFRRATTALHFEPISDFEWITEFYCKVTENAQIKLI